MPRSGTLVICVQNLDFSGANQVVLNIVMGRMHESNVVVLSPKVGTFGARFVESGAAVRVGDLEDLLNEIRDVFCIICNTIMTANIVVEMSERPHPILWILHEWWDDEMIRENLRIRNYQGLTLNTVKDALAKADMVICVCESQRQLYNPTAPSSVIFVGVPDPVPRQLLLIHDGTPDEITSTDVLHRTKIKHDRPFTFLCLGIVCPRKNQLWTVELFKKFAQGKENVRLQIVGARYIRVYEIEYLQQVKDAIGNDCRIELIDVSEDVDKFYRTADCLILTSLNEVTPMVISEALSWGIPVLSTNIAGIKEMYSDGVEGFLFAPGEEAKALDGMQMLYEDEVLRATMGRAARRRFETCFDLDLMVESYRKLVLKAAPPVILLDMDGAMIDWDAGFLEKWGVRSPVDRSKSYYMEHCVPEAFFQQAVDVYMEQGFFEALQPMEGALKAIREMEKDGFKIYICTAPIVASSYCAQEKLNWINKHLGPKWMDRVILCQDKTMVAGDLLIDDKPYEHLSPGGKHTTATWKQIIFDAPYNRQKRLPRLFHWKDWKSLVYPLLGKSCPSEVYALSLDEYDGMLKKNGLQRPASLNVGKIKRDSSYQSLSSALSAEDVQKQHDMLQHSSTPLKAEDIATIVSGSLSLVDEIGSSEDEIEIQRTMEATGKPFLSPNSAAQKKKVLDEKQQERNKSYLKSKEATERKLLMESDSVEVEGLQIFRTSYKTWKNQGSSGDRKGGTSYIATK